MAHPHQRYWLWGGGNSLTSGAALVEVAQALDDAGTTPLGQNLPIRGPGHGRTRQANRVGRPIEAGQQHLTWARNTQHVFISFKHEDLDFAENMIGRLEKEGFPIWADSRIEPGQQWQSEIDLAIKNAFVLIVIMTPEAKASEYVTYEWAFALGIGIRVIPVLLRLTQLHPRLGGLQYLDFTHTRSRPWERLFEEIKAASRSLLTMVRPCRAPHLACGRTSSRWNSGRRSCSSSIRHTLERRRHYGQGLDDLGQHSAPWPELHRPTEKFA
jgi:hypothetical protein